MNPVKFGKADEFLKEYLEKNRYNSIAILVDENTHKYCFPIIRNTFSEILIIQVPSGEINKNLDTCSTIWKELTANRFSRHDLLINLGGGVICDMGGFCAATYKRGIHFLNIPTTLLSQVDASVGGKLGVDFQGYKNHIGLFGEPKSVLIDQQFLSTLPPRQLLSGFAEVIKHSLISDREHWEEVSSFDPGADDWSKIISKSINVKKEIVENDFRETGRRKVLNFGHTIGHGIESLYLNTEKELLHGEAIAAGIIMESWLSSQLYGLTESDLEKITNKILKHYGKVIIEKEEELKIKELMLMDKKNKDNKVMFSLLKDIGSAVYDVNIGEELVSQSIEFYRNL